SIGILLGFDPGFGRYTCAGHQLASHRLWHRCHYFLCRYLLTDLKTSHRTEYYLGRSGWSFSCTDCMGCCTRHYRMACSSPVCCYLPLDPAALLAAVAKI